MSKMHEARRASPLNINDNVSNMSSAGDHAGEQEEIDRNLAERLSAIIEGANEKCTPLCNRIRKVREENQWVYIHPTNDFASPQHIEGMEARKEEDRDEAELVKNVTPLLEQAEKILNETNGAIRGADPDNRLSNKATRDMQEHKATPEEQRVAEALKVVSTSRYYYSLVLLLMIFFS